MAIGKGKTGYFIGGIFGVAILILSIRFFIGNTYRKQIPELPDFKNLTGPLQEQLSIAWNKAYRKPTSGNLGMLGMVYHSNMFYDKATRCYELATKKDKKEWLWDYFLGYLNQEMGDQNAAIKNYSEVTSKNSEIFLAWYYKGECYQKAGLSDSAELSFKYIIRRMDKKAVVKTATRYDYFPLVTYAMYDLARI